MSHNVIVIKRFFAVFVYIPFAVICRGTAAEFSEGVDHVARRAETAFVGDDRYRLRAVDEEQFCAAYPEQYQVFRK